MKKIWLYYSWALSSSITMLMSMIFGYNKPFMCGYDWIVVISFISTEIPLIILFIKAPQEFKEGRKN